MLNPVNYARTLMDDFRCFRERSSSKYILDHLRCGPYLLMRRHTNDRQVVRTVFLHDAYGIGWLGHLLHFKDLDDKSVLDIGAHIGCFTVAALYGNACRVVAYEPSPESVRLLQANLALARCGLKALPPVDVIQAAVAGETGTASLHTSSRFPTGDSLDGREDHDGSKEVMTVAASDVLKERFDFMKCDCEGAERYIIPLLPDSRVEEFVMELHGSQDTSPLSMEFSLRYDERMRILRGVRR